MPRRPGWLQRLRNGSHEIAAAVRPHDHTAIFDPTQPIVVPEAADDRVTVLEPDPVLR